MTTDRFGDWRIFFRGMLATAINDGYRTNVYNISMIAIKLKGGM